MQRTAARPATRSHQLATSLTAVHAQLFTGVSAEETPDAGAPSAHRGRAPCASPTRRPPPPRAGPHTSNTVSRHPPAQPRCKTRQNGSLLSARAAGAAVRLPRPRIRPRPHPAGRHAPTCGVPPSKSLFHASCTHMLWWGGLGHLWPRGHWASIYTSPRHVHLPPHAHAACVRPRAAPAQARRVRRGVGGQGGRRASAASSVG